ncbi:hypothetical protein [Actinoplanes sp. NPDC020271]|uniref:protein kinase domain-containing protein n=1 Tax=Actinoplanes sp. NPDC020271 TaxID=3363896 RepID=UPI0037A305B2
MSSGLDDNGGNQPGRAPERLGAGDAGVASDLWSFGAMLYAAAEGRPPFARGDAAASPRALLSDPPAPPRLAGPLTPLILTLLDKDPARRPSAADVESRLRALLRPRRTRLVLASLAAAALATTVTVVVQHDDRRLRSTMPAAMPPASVPASPTPATIRHERRALIPAADQHSYLLRWRVAGPDWFSTVAVQRGLVDRFRSVA